MAKFNGVVLTADAIYKTRQHFADNAAACIIEVARGDVRVNDPDKYFKHCADRAEAALRGDSDHTLTFLQYAYWLQTGECIALLP